MNTVSEIDVSVVIVSWNTRDLLGDCLRALEENSDGLRMEVWVVDNRSSDGSAAMVRAEFPHVKVLANDSNLGFARAANQGVQQARGRYILLLNSDTRVLSGALRRMVTFLDGEPRAAVCGPQLLHEDGRLQNSVSNFPTVATELLNKSLLRWLFPRRFPRKEPGGTDPREVESVIGAAMMVRGEAVDEVGPLDGGYFFFLEETDWCLRFSRAGWKVYQVPQARVVHLQGKSAEKVHIRTRIEYFRSRYTYFRKHHGLAGNAVIRIGLPLRVFMNVLANGAVSLFGLLKGRGKERFRVYGSILLWHLRGCPDGFGLEAKRD
jgi:GT2 family glycosyltransferase